jgi:hypothetical protein
VRRAQRGRRKRKGRRSQPPGDGMVRVLDRALEDVNARCDALRRTLEHSDIAALEQNAYTLAAAWFLAEASAMQIIGVSAGSAACRQYARRAITATSAVVTARFGEALAETLKWLGREPKPQGMAGLRTTLAQLAARVDVRGVDMALYHKQRHGLAV